MSEPMKLLTCATCGTSYRPDATPDGLCPTCLIARGSDEATRPPGTGPSDPRRAPPSLDELAPHFPQLELLEVLGRGGMGAVYKARQKELGRVVALKILPGDVGDDPDFAERFRREARALASLSHAGIVAVHDFGNAGGWWWFLMEYVDGATLRGLLADGPVEPSLALSIVRQVCDALDYAHGRGVVHRDIKPENILVDRDGRVKLVDFGLARLVGGDARDLSLTYTGQRMGTPHYMAPEQWERPGDVDHRADIYALGVVFYELLTRELPVGRFRPPSEAAGVPDDIDRIVLKALERDREQRYQHSSEMSTDCETSANRPAAKREKRRAKKAASSTRDAWLPEARGWAPWFAKTFWMLGSGAVLAGVATLVPLGVVLAVGEGDQRSVLRQPFPDGPPRVDELVLVVIACILLGSLCAVFSRHRAHQLDRRAADDPDGPVRPWMARRGFVPVTSLAGVAMLSLAVEAEAPSGPLTGVFEFGVLLGAVAVVGLLARGAWRVLPDRVSHRVPVVVFGVLALLVLLPLFAERKADLGHHALIEARLHDDAGRPLWRGERVDAEVIDALAAQRSVVAPVDGWVSARFVPRERISRTEPAAVAWEFEVREPAGVRDGTVIAVRAEVDEPLDASGVRVRRADAPGFAVTAIELGDGPNVHRVTIPVGMTELAAARSDERYAEWGSSLQVRVCRPGHGVRLPSTRASWSTFRLQAGGTSWTYDAEPFTTLMTDRYPDDFPAPVGDDALDDFDVEPIGWRVLSRSLIRRDVTEDDGVESAWAFHGPLRVAGAFDVPVPFAVAVEIHPTDAWLDAAGVSVDEPFGRTALVRMPGEPLALGPSDANVPPPAPNDVGVSSELIRAWSELPLNVTFTETGDDWRARFADDVFNHRVDAVRLVLRPSRDAALAAPYDVTEYWAGDPVDVTVPLLR